MNLKDRRDLCIDKNSTDARLMKAKEIESKTKMYSKRLNNKTIVFCKRKERIEEFEKAINPIKKVKDEL